MRRLVALTALVAAVLGIAGFGLLRDQATPSAVQRALAADLDRLRGDDGLYRGGLTDGPGLFESAYGLAALAAAGQADRLSVDKAVVNKAAFAAQIPADPLWNRRYLALLEKTTRARLHDATDVTALRAMHTSAGYFADPVAAGRQAADPGYRLATTDAALEALAGFGVRLPDSDRRATVRWLETIGSLSARSSLTQRLHLLRARLALGLGAPEDLRPTVRNWWLRTGASYDHPLRGNEFVEICSYIQLSVSLGIDLTGQHGRLATDLDPASPPDDPQEQQMLVDAWLSLHDDPNALEPLRRLLRKRQLPSGLMSSTRYRLGDVQASQQVETLRRLAGLPTGDAPLAAALRAHRGDLRRSSPGATANWLSVLAAADRPAAAADAALRRRAIAEAPRTLSAKSAQAWSSSVSALTSLHLAVPPVKVSIWPADTPEHRYERYLAIAGLAKINRLSALPDPGSPDLLAAEGVELLAGGSLHQADAALIAAQALRWRPTPTDRDRLLGLLGRLKGCPGTPALFRDSSTSRVCDVYSTASAWRIYRMLKTGPSS
jgi:hypothetical protein